MTRHFHPFQMTNLNFRSSQSTAKWMTSSYKCWTSFSMKIIKWKLLLRNFYNNMLLLLYQRIYKNWNSFLFKSNIKNIISLQIICYLSFLCGERGEAVLILDEICVLKWPLDRNFIEYQFETVYNFWWVVALLSPYTQKQAEKLKSCKMKDEGFG